MGLCNSNKKKIWFSKQHYHHGNPLDIRVMYATPLSSPVVVVSLPVSQIWALMTLLSTWMLRVANSTPMVLLDSKLNSLRVNLPRRLVLPTPESPMRTTRTPDELSDQARLYETQHTFKEIVIFVVSAHVSVFVICKSSERWGIKQRVEKEVSLYKNTIKRKTKVPLSHHGRYGVRLVNM